jgi:hypothetical protein
MQEHPLLEQLALELCPERADEFSGEIGWKCASACRACRRDASAMLGRLATEARLQGLPVAGDWLDGVAAQQPEHNQTPT